MLLGVVVDTPAVRGGDAGRDTIGSALDGEDVVAL